MMFSGRLGCSLHGFLPISEPPFAINFGVLSEDYAIMVFLFLRPGLHGGMGGRCGAACTLNRVRTGHAVRD